MSHKLQVYSRWFMYEEGDYIEYIKLQDGTIIRLNTVYVKIKEGI